MNLFSGTLVRLAELQRADLPLYASWFRDYEVERFLLPEVVIPMTDEAEAEWYERASKSTDGYTFGICTLDENILIGNCSLFEISQKNRVATFGIFVGNKEYWGKGYGSDATRIMLRFAFDELNLNRVQLEVYAFNQRAIRAYEKVGFVHEGTRRAALFREGRYHDIHMMAILSEEWRTQDS
jgi:RimJ/RimL family protein N-acetyltransferase